MNVNIVVKSEFRLSNQQYTHRPLQDISSKQIMFVLPTYIHIHIIMHSALKAASL
jgi:hypothetical protein